MTANREEVQVLKLFKGRSKFSPLAGLLIAGAVVLPSQSSIAAPARAGVGPAPVSSIPPNEILAAPARAVVNQVIKQGGLPLSALTPNQARQLPGNPDWENGVLGLQHRPPAGLPVGKISHILIPTPAGALIARVYRPAGTGPFPILVYFHGGGWVIGNLDTYDISARALTVMARFIVVSVAYRQAPEHPFPAAANDAYASLQWVMHHAAQLGGIPGRVAVGGESAGGNLAAVAALMSRDKHGLMPIYQMLIYPITNYNFNTPSYRTEVKTIPLNTPSMKWFWSHYLRTAADGLNPYASPLRAPNLANLPPALVITDQNDPLRSEGKQYAYRLSRYGVSVQYTYFPHMMHEFFGMGQVIPAALRAEQEAAQALRRAASH